MIATSYLATRSLLPWGARSVRECALTALGSNESRGNQAAKIGCRRSVPPWTPSGTQEKAHKKPSALPAQTATFQQTSKFNSHLPPSQPAWSLCHCHCSHCIFCICNALNRSLELAIGVEKAGVRCREILQPVNAEVHSSSGRQRMA